MCGSSKRWVLTDTLRVDCTCALSLRAGCGVWSSTTVDASLKRKVAFRHKYKQQRWLLFRNDSPPRLNLLDRGDRYCCAHLCIIYLFEVSQASPFGSLAYNNLFHTLSALCVNPSNYVRLYNPSPVSISLMLRKTRVMNSPTREGVSTVLQRSKKRDMRSLKAGTPYHRACEVAKN